MDDSNKGLYDKFRVERTDGASGPGRKHHGCQYFPLDLTHDPHAVPAIIAYAASCRAENPTLTQELCEKAAECIVNPGITPTDDHWINTSAALLLGVILHVLYHEQDKSLAGVAAFLTNPLFCETEQLLEAMQNAVHDADRRTGWATRTHSVVAAAAQMMLGKKENERRSIFLTLKTKLMPHIIPIQSTAKNDVITFEI